MTTQSKIIWYVAGAEEGMFERIIEGVLNDAIDCIKRIAHEAGFILGQILAADGKVLATVAPNGIIRLN